MGAHPVPGGWNFVVFSSHAHAVELCFFDREDLQREIARVRLPHHSGDLFHGAVAGVEPGQPYGLRAYGPWAPERGQLFNPAKLLLDPWGRAVTGEVHGDPHQSHARRATDGSLQPDPVDSAPFVPRSVIAEPLDAYPDSHRPRHDGIDLAIYELHVRGFSRLNHAVPEGLRGTFAGLAHEASIAHLKELGISAVQLMPVHLRMDDLFLRERGLQNYWGYQTVNFFTPDPRFCTLPGDPLDGPREFRAMVEKLHAAGIEVILDVVYNHTGEGGARRGASISCRGLDSLSYFRQPADNAGVDQDFTGTGNTLDTSHPRVLQLVMDSLRYWVEILGVDGFRFDLAATIGRDQAGHFWHHAALFRAMSQDPVLARARLIAEPWDLGPGGYQVGGFPAPWAELNGKFRDTLRRFWKGDGGQIGEFASRLTGSEDLYGNRGPQASVNFFTSHDGFTLRDLVSFNEKHNQANGEDNRDGESHNLSWNCGAEGPSPNAKINRLRRRQQRNFLATLALSQGVPFLLMGDEVGRSQGGNNNGYCQDREEFWLDWDLDDEQRRLNQFMVRVMQLRRKHVAFRRRRFLHGNRMLRHNAHDALWLDADGQLMSTAEWQDPERRHLGLLLSGITATSKQRWRLSRTDAAFLLLFSAEGDEQEFVLPGEAEAVAWRPLLDTAQEDGLPLVSRLLAGGQRVELVPRQILVFVQVGGDAEQAEVLP